MAAARWAVASQPAEIRLILLNTLLGWALGTSPRVTVIWEAARPQASGAVIPSTALIPTGSHITRRGSAGPGRRTPGAAAKPKRVK